MRILIPCLLFTCVVFAGAAVLPAMAEVEDGDCAMCHEEVVAAYQDTGHALATARGGGPGCQSCHGPGDAHIEEGGDPDRIIRPQDQSPEESSDGCLSCHGRNENHFSGRQGTHRLGDVGCIECHNPHSPEDGMLRERGAALCASCHQGVAARFGMPRSHPMAENGPGCVSCHDPHATGSLHPARAAVERCGRCHFEKTGPFLYSHDTVLVDGCSTCHEIHGSTGRHLLVQETQVNLCYSCHGGGLTPGWHSAQRFLGEKCTACHTAIHGSNTSQFFLEE